MSVTSGFFNSLNHDRRYNAQQLSAIFDGIINDGVFANIGVAFAISVDTGVTINVGEGRAWFNSAWVYNDSLLPKTLEGSEVVLDRIDAVVIEIDHSESVRFGDIKIVKGTPSSNPQRPVMAQTESKHQYPIAYIYRKAGSAAITQADITNMVGTSSCPYVTGILQVQSIDNIVAQWEDQWNQWYANTVSKADNVASELLADMKSEFDIWFADVKAILEDDVATTLAAQVATLQGKFDTLAREGAVYDVIEDHDFDPILGSDGTPIEGKAALGVSANVTDVDMSAYAKKTDLASVAETKLNRTEKYVRNLLDNSDFTNPVNQRGKTSYDFPTGGGHTIDRWISNGAMEIVDGGASVKRGSFRQRIENIRKDRMYTLAAEDSDGNIYIRSAVPENSESNNGADFELYCSSSGFVAVGLKIGLTYKWAALYEGEYTADNLPCYQPKGKGVEMFECFRYYQEHSPNVHLFRNANGGYTYLLKYHGKMRAIPDVTFEGTAQLTSTINDGYARFDGSDGAYVSYVCLSADL